MTRAIDTAFTPAVQAIQAQRGSRAAYAGRDMGDTITDDLRGFIANRDSAYLATASAGGQPYVQHRGGPAGFLRVLDDRTIGFADYRGNRQYITTGNLSENPQAFLFLMDYANRARVKIWGRARVSDDAELIAGLMPEGGRGKPEQALLFDVAAWDANCPQHIPVKLGADEVAGLLASRDARIQALEAELAQVRGRA